MLSLNKKLKTSLILLLSAVLCFEGIYLINLLRSDWSETSLYAGIDDTVQVLWAEESAATKEVVLTEDVFILMYHYIRDAGNSYADHILSTSPEIFEQHLQWLNENGYTSYTMNELTGMKAVPEKSVVLTFDDGYEDFYTAALPLLEKYNIKATVGVIWALIGEENYMSTEQVRDIHERGVEIANHSHSHNDMSFLDGQSFFEEIDASEQVLNEILEGLDDNEVTTFILPFWRSNNDTEMYLFGRYDHVLSTSPWHAHTPLRNQLIPRLDMDGNKDIGEILQ